MTAVTILSILIDVLLVALFAVFLVWFAKYGLARTVSKIGKTWLSFACSVFLAPRFAAFIQNLFLQKVITNGIYSTLKALVENNVNGYNIQQLFQNLPEGLLRFLEHYNVSIAALEAEFGASTSATANIVQAISLRIATPCVEMLSSIIAFLFCFFIPLIFFHVMNKQIRNITKKDKNNSKKFSYVKSLVLFYSDKVLGILVGLVIGGCAALGVSILIHTAFQTVIAFNATSSVMEIHAASHVFKFLSNFDVMGIIRQLF